MAGVELTASRSFAGISPGTVFIEEPGYMQWSTNSSILLIIPQKPSVSGFSGRSLRYSGRRAISTRSSSQMVCGRYVFIIASFAIEPAKIKTEPRPVVEYIRVDNCH